MAILKIKKLLFASVLVNVSKLRKILRNFIYIRYLNYFTKFSKFDKGGIILDRYRPGITIGYELIQKKKYKTILIIIAIFFIIGVIMIIKGIGDLKTYSDLEKENVVVIAKLYSPNRTSLDGEKYSTKYYEWYYNGKYYSGKISSFDGKTQKKADETEYELYIDSQNPKTYARVDKEIPVGSGVIMGSILVILSILCMLPILILKRKDSLETQ